MKIVLVMGMYSYGGAERVMCFLANHFVNLGNEVSLITVTRGEETYFLDEKVKRVNGLGWKNEFDGVLKLRKAIKKEKPDVVISFLAHINIAVILATLFTGIKIIVSERNDPAKSATSRARVLLRRIIYPFSNGFVFQTEDARKYFSKGIQKKSVVIPNPIFLEEESVNFDERKDEIVSVGRFVPQKRQDLIIKAFAKIEKDYPEYKLVLYGEDGGKKEECEKLIASLALEQKIKLVDAIPNIHNEIKQSKIFVLASEYEGMPNALMEAMGLGLVCISTDCPCGGPKSLITNNIDGILVPVNDLGKIASALKNVLEDNKKQNDISIAAQNIRERYKPEVIMSQWDKVITSI